MKIEITKWLKNCLNLLKKHPIIVLPFLFYLFTACPTIGLGDTALLVDGVQQKQINTHVNNHNITLLFGIIFSFLARGNFAYRITLVSVFFGSLTIIIFYLILWRNFHSRTTASIGALILMVSHSMWWHSSILEVYAVNGFFTVLVIWLLVELQKAYKNRLLYTLFLVAGLAIFNHVQMGFILIGSSVFLLLKMLELNRKNTDYLPLFWKSLGFFLLGVSPYLIVFIKDVYISKNFQQTLNSALGGDFKNIMFKGNFLDSLDDVIYLIFKQFPSPFLLAIAIGLILIVFQWKISKSFWALITMFSVNTYFFMFYQTWDKFAFLLPSFIILAFFGSFGLEKARRLSQNYLILKLLFGLSIVLAIAFPVYFYSQLSIWGKNPGIWYARYNNNYTQNTHNAAKYIANPNKHNFDDIEEYAMALFKKLPKNSIYIDDDSRTYYPVKYYQQYYNYRPDLKVQIINSWGFENWGLNQQQFISLLKNSYEENQDFFVVTIDHPFRDFISLLPPSESNFQKFPLDEKRWIYKLRTKKEISTNLTEKTFSLPKFRRLFTGVNLNTNTPLEKKQFTPYENIMVKLLFDNNTNPFWLNFRWLNPNNQVYFTSQPFLVSTGNTSVWSFLEKQQDFPSGIWQVEALSDGKALMKINFEVDNDE